jgi:D-glycero-D-manno-heptose 1,7-bisphosphate phosphatase
VLVILDRDGVINYDSREYIKSPDEWIEIPGSIFAISKLKKAGHQVVVATNQSGLHRGLYNQATLDKIHQKMSDALAQYDEHFDGIFYCPHSPKEHCDCRKPKPGLYRQIESQFHIPWSQAISVGDSLRDIQAAQAVGCSAALVRTGNGEITLAGKVGLEGVPVYADLSAFAEEFLQKFPH